MKNNITLKKGSDKIISCNYHHKKPNFEEYQIFAHDNKIEDFKSYLDKIINQQDEL